MLQDVEDPSSKRQPMGKEGKAATNRTVQNLCRGVHLGLLILCQSMRAVSEGLMSSEKQRVLSNQVYLMATNEEKNFFFVAQTQFMYARSILWSKVCITE